MSKISVSRLLKMKQDAPLKIRLHSRGVEFIGFREHVAVGHE